MNSSSIFIENLRTSTIYNINDIRTTQFSLNSLGNYVYQVLNSSTIQTIQSQFSNYANLSTSNFFLYPPQTNAIATLSNHLVTKDYVDNVISNVSNIDSLNHLWTGDNSFQNSLNILNGISNYSDSINVSSPQKIGNTYYGEWSPIKVIDSSYTILNTLIFELPGVWQIQTQFEYSGEGIITQMNMGYENNIMYREDMTAALETNDILQRFVPFVLINHQGTNSINIVANGQINTGIISCRCKYFYVRIA